MNALPPPDPEHAALVQKVKAHVLAKCDREKLRAAVLRKTQEHATLEAQAIDEETRRFDTKRHFEEGRNA